MSDARIKQILDQLKEIDLDLTTAEALIDEATRAFPHDLDFQIMLEMKRLEVDLKRTAVNQIRARAAEHQH